MNDNSPHFKPLPVFNPMQRQSGSSYPDELTMPIRQELVNLGVTELTTKADVDAALAKSRGSAVVLINSVCGCAAGGARPGLLKAMAEAEVRPDQILTAFAGVHKEAVDAVRALVPAPASSPSIILFKEGKPIMMMHRSDIEVRDANGVADVLKHMFKEVCATPAT